METTCKIILSKNVDEEVWLISPKIKGKQFTINLKKIATMSGDDALIDLCERIQGKRLSESAYTCTYKTCPECYANRYQRPHKNYCPLDKNTAKKKRIK